MRLAFLMFFFGATATAHASAQVFRCSEPTGSSMWSQEGHKLESDGFKGVNPIITIDEKEMTVIWGNSQSAGGQDKAWKAMIFTSDPEVVSALAIDAGETGEAIMLYTMNIKRGFLYLSSHKENKLFGGSAVQSFVAKCTTR